MAKKKLDRAPLENPKEQEIQILYFFHFKISNLFFHIGHAPILPILNFLLFQAHTVTLLSLPIHGTCFYLPVLLIIVFQVAVNLHLLLLAMEEPLTLDLLRSKYSYYVTINDN
jgi:hypothetical protein